jgi:hypothetical protein
MKPIQRRSRERKKCSVERAGGRGWGWGGARAVAFPSWKTRPSINKQTNNIYIYIYIYRVRLIMQNKIISPNVSVDAVKTKNSFIATPQNMTSRSGAPAGHTDLDVTRDVTSLRTLLRNLEGTEESLGIDQPKCWRQTPKLNSRIG